MLLLQVVELKTIDYTVCVLVFASVQVLLNLFGVKSLKQIWLHLESFIEVMHSLNVVLNCFWYLLRAGVWHFLVWENILISIIANILIFYILTFHLAEWKRLILLIILTILLRVSFWRHKLLISIFIFNNGFISLFLNIIIVKLFQLIKWIFIVFNLLNRFSRK